jgi:hypothetical protein
MEYEKKNLVIVREANGSDLYNNLQIVGGERRPE